MNTYDKWQIGAKFWVKIFPSVCKSVFRGMFKWMWIFIRLAVEIRWLQGCGNFGKTGFVCSAILAKYNQITRLMIAYSTVYSGANQRKHQSSASLAFVRGIHQWPVNSPHKGQVTRKMFPFDDVIMTEYNVQILRLKQNADAYHCEMLLIQIREK